MTMQPSLVRPFICTRIIATAGVVLAFAITAPASETKEESQEGAQKLLADAVAAVKAYVYATPPSSDAIEVFDIEKGDLVRMAYQKVQANDGGWVALDDTHWALAAECKAKNGDDADGKKRIVSLELTDPCRCHNAHGEG